MANKPKNTQLPSPPKKMLGEAIADLNSLFRETLLRARYDADKSILAQRAKAEHIYYEATERKAIKLRRNIVKILSQSLYYTPPGQSKVASSMSSPICKTLSLLPKYEQDALIAAPRDMINDAVDDILEKAKRKQAEYLAMSRSLNEEHSLDDAISFQQCLAEAGNHPSIYAADNDDDNDPYGTHGYSEDDGWRDSSGFFHPFSYRYKYNKSNKNKNQNNNQSGAYDGRNYGYYDHTPNRTQSKGSYTYSRHSGHYGYNKFPELDKYETPYSIRKWSSYQKQKEYSAMKFYSNDPHIPLILIPDDVRRKIWALVDESSIEISWHCLLRRLTEEETNGITDIYQIDDILMFPQMNSSSTTTTDDADYQKWLDSIPDEKFNHIRCHMHSHVKMRTTPSSVDQTYRNNIMSLITRDDDFYLFAILNKDREYTLSLFVPADKCEYEQNDVMVFEGTFEEWVEDCKKQSLIRTLKCERLIDAIVFDETADTSECNINIFKTNITDARKAYDALSTAEKEKVTNYQHLEKAEARIQERKIFEKILYCMSKINLIPNDLTDQKVLVAFAESINDAKKVYEGLPDAIKETFKDKPIYNKLENALIALANNQASIQTSINDAKQWAKDQIKINVDDYAAEKRGKLNLTTPATDAPATAATTTQQTTTDGGADTGIVPTAPTNFGTKEVSKIPSAFANDPQTFIRGRMLNCLSPSTRIESDKKLLLWIRNHIYGDNPNITRKSWRDEVIASTDIFRELFPADQFGQAWIEFTTATDITKDHIVPEFLKQNNEQILRTIKEQLDLLRTAVGFDRIRHITSDQFEIMLSELKRNGGTITTPTYIPEISILSYSPNHHDETADILSKEFGNIAGIVLKNIPAYFGSHDASQRARKLAHDYPPVMNQNKVLVPQKFNVLYTNYFMRKFASK